MAKISTKNLSTLPDVLQLQRLCKSLATLDAIISDDWSLRYYSYNKNWDKENKEEFFEMRDGSGDEFKILFNQYGAIINGFAHESQMSNWIEREVPPSTFMDKLGKFFGKKETDISQKIWKGVIDSVPPEFKAFILEEPVKSSGTTFCIWRKFTDDKWNIGNIQFPNDDYGDGSVELLYILNNDPSTYVEWAIEYYDEFFEDHELNVKLVKHIYDHELLTKEIVDQINPEIMNYEALKNDFNEIGYDYSGF